MIKNYGFNEKDVVITDEDYLLGSLPQKVVNESGNWESSLPKYEPQASKYETFGCTAWGSLNQLETYMKHVFGGEYNYSDRFTYLLANISPPGAPPSRVYESIRKKGVIDDPLLPYADTYDEFLQPDPMLSEFTRKGLEWHSKYKFNHEWIDNPDPDKIKDALKLSPVAVSVTAWEKVDGLYIDRGQRNTHWCDCFFVNGSSPIVQDSYDQEIKPLHPDHHIKYAKRIYVTKRDKPLEIKKVRRWWWDFNIFKTYKFNI